VNVLYGTRCVHICLLFIRSRFPCDHRQDRVLSDSEIIEHVVVRLNLVVATLFYDGFL
jgi:hypothetical protein